VIAHERGAETLDLVELGPSAGLNLLWDRYRYVYRAGTWGSSALTLQGVEHDDRFVFLTYRVGHE